MTNKFFMKKKNYLIILALFVIYNAFNNYIFQFMLVGTYKNVNFKGSPAFPRSPDTLILYGNNKFYSAKLGHGNYSLNHGFFSTNISFRGNDNINTFVSRTWLGIPKINMFFDLDHFYEKMSSRAE